MTLPNRVDPFGELFADPARGLLFGNRGGRFHRDDRTLATRRWASRQWICCVLDFKGRQRDVWGRYYTELFFLDEPTALAAGHRPCFECRRKDAQAFAAAMAAGRRLPATPTAPEMDRLIHAERLDGRAKRRHRLSIDHLPDGAFLTPAAGAGDRLRGARRRTAAVDAGGLRVAAAAAGRDRRGRPDAALDACGAVGRLSAAMAPKRRQVADFANKSCLLRPSAGHIFAPCQTSVRRSGMGVGGITPGFEITALECRQGRGGRMAISGGVRGTRRCQQQFD